MAVGALRGIMSYVYDAFAKCELSTPVNFRDQSLLHCRTYICFIVSSKQRSFRFEGTQGHSSFWRFSHTCLLAGRLSVILAALRVVIRSPTLDRQYTQSSGISQGDGLEPSPNFIGIMRDLLTLAPRGRSSLWHLSHTSNFSAAPAKKGKHL